MDNEWPKVFDELLMTGGQNHKHHSKANMNVCVLICSPSDSEERCEVREHTEYSNNGASISSILYEPGNSSVSTDAT